ncbi:3-isopropylmalate dehydratase small subunit [Bryobacter aggregatus]|uniref:3-isopropylmalate dehydratase small subunit n=1 Tax=Bryobacter aggregatus TaxID=360054 RepID=UPI0004E0E509|nr:3-isopropylmalate dehydratase small subunit [Bryobacter aggregatus]
MEKFVPFESRMVVMPIDNIDTDQVIPARFLKKTDRVGWGELLFNDWRYEADGAPKPDFVLNQDWAKECKVLLAGDNFGCGSSREHAPWALTQYGFRAILSTSFADIFKSNSLKNSLLPIVVSPETHKKLLSMPEGTVKVDLASRTLTLPDGSTAEFPVDSFSQQCMLEGVDELGFILKHSTEIAAYEVHRDSTLNTLDAA